MSVEKADTLTLTADLKSIRLTNAEVGATVGSPQEVGPVTMVLDKELAAEMVGDRGDEILVRVEFTVNVLPEIQEGDEGGGSEAELPDPVVWIHPAFELHYQLPAGAIRPTETELRVFADATATFNAWPYLREFVQSMLSRMDLPRMTLPLLRRRPARTPAQEIPQANHSQG